MKDRRRSNTLMQFNYSYKGSTGVVDRAGNTEMSFSPDTLRPPTYFIGELSQNVAFREAISALHDVVVSDQRFKPKDKTAYKEWRAKQEEIDWDRIMAERGEVSAKINALTQELNEIYQRHSLRMKPYYTARGKFQNFVLEKQLDFYFVFDPVITVHPDEVFFECFSVDESSYGRLSASYEVFKNIKEFACGTTNIDYSQSLYNEFQKIRSYKQTFLNIDPSGFEVQTTNEEDYKEVKIDLPESWVRGFLQVSSAMTLPALKLELQPLDIYNICLVLRRNKEKKGPRSLRYQLKPNQPIKIIVDPWGIEINCPRSIYTGTQETEIRVWGRRRINILERLIPIANKFTVYLLGTGMPSFYVADLGSMSFTLGLSGWTKNDWSTSGNFDLLTSRTEVDHLTQKQIYHSLKENWRDSVDNLSQRLNLSKSVVLGALSAYTQAGRVMFDLNKGVYRIRELSRDPLPIEQLRFANPREESAIDFLTRNAITIHSIESSATQVKLLGEVRDRSTTYTPSLTLDEDDRIIEANCTCSWHYQHQLYQGPCEHLLALRQQFTRSTRQNPVIA